VIYYFGENGGKNYKRLESDTSSGAIATNETLFQIVNPNLPFGGVGASGYGRYHGEEGFKAFSNLKSVFKKPALNFYPYSKVYPPFTADKQKLIRFLCTYLKASQSKVFKRFIALVILILILRGVATRRINKETFLKLATFVKELVELVKKTVKSL
jgi:hypothetical protein